MHIHYLVIFFFDNDRFRFFIIILFFHFICLLLLFAINMQRSKYLISHFSNMSISDSTIIFDE